MKLFRSILFLLLFLNAFGLKAQQMDIKGTIYDSTGTKPLYQSMVMAVRVRDSVLLSFTRSDSEGKFSLKGFEVDTFSLIIEHPGHDAKTYYIFGHADNYEITIPSVVMPTKMQELEEVVIYAYKDPIYYKGDTLVYVADSFATHEGAVVEDLLKKLPGISVDKDGKITSQGQEISKVLVDGDEFFGTDPTIATKNLGADGIEEVQVYEAENEDGIGGSDEKIQVLDLKLKEDAKKGYFGRVSGASDFALTPINGKIGTNPFYEGELLLNKFKGAQKISIFALGSNTPRSSFGWGDMNKFGLDNEEGTGNRWDPNSGGGNTSGVPQTLKAGVYFSDKIGAKKRTKVGFNYSYYNDRLDATSASQSQYFLTDSSYVTDDSTRNYTFNESHRLNLDFESQLDSLTTLRIKPSITLDGGNTDNSQISEFFDRSMNQTLGTEVYNVTESSGFTAGGYAALNRKFMKKKRELEVRYDLEMEDNQTDGYLISLTNYYSAMLPNDETRQKNNNYNSLTSHYGTITYIEPLAKTLKLELEYLYEYSFNNKNKSTFDFNDGLAAYSDFNSTFSNRFENTRNQHRGGAKLIFEPVKEGVNKHRIVLGARFRNVNIDNVNLITDTTINQSINNILPRFSYEFKPSMSKRLRVEYETYSSAPSVNDLAPVQDNTNPNRIQEGNPDLLPNYVHNFSAFFNNWNALTGRFVWAGGNVMVTQNDFSSETSYDEFGRTYSKTINVDGNMNAFIYSGAGFPFLGRKIEIRPELNGSFIKYSNVISGSKNTTDNYAITPSTELIFRLLGDSMEIELSGSYAFNNAISTLNDAVTKTPYSVESYGADVRWRLPKGFGFGVNGTYTKNAQPGEGFYNTEYFVLNTEVSKKFLKTQNLEVAIRGNDILNQNINARREVNGNIVTDYRTTIISRYFLLKVTLRFNNRRTQEDDFTGFH